MSIPHLYVSISVTMAIGVMTNYGQYGYDDEHISADSYVVITELLK